MIKSKEGKVLTHGSRLGQVFKSRSVTLGLGYVPLEDRLAQIQLAGLNTLMAADRKQLLYDGVEPDQLPPPLPRHFEPDIADVSQLYRLYREQRKEIVAVAKDRLKAKESAPQVSPAEAPPKEDGKVTAGGKA